MPTIPQNDIGFTSIKNVAEIAGLSYRTVRKDVDRGLLRALKRGAGRSCRVMIPVDAVHEYLTALVAESTPLGPNRGPVAEAGHAPE